MISGLGPDRLVSVVVGCAYGYPLAQVVDELQDCAPVLGDLPYDPDAADTLGGLRDQRARFARSSLLKHAGKIAASIGSRVLNGPPTTDMKAPPAVVPPSPPSGPASALDRTSAPARGSSSKNVPQQVPSAVLPEWRVVPVSPPPPVPRHPGGHTDAPATGGTR